MPKPEFLRTQGWLFLAVIAAISLRGYHLGHGGLGDPTASGTVFSMLQSWHHFFFVTWDPAATYMHDKPPFALWLQALSARLLGYHGFALMLPQAIAGILTMLCVYRLTSRMHDRTHAVVTVWLLAILPLTVLVERSNKQDAVLALCMTLCITALVEAMLTRKTRYLILAAVAFGCGFNVKGLAIGMIVPSALVLLWREDSWRELRRWPVLLLSLALALGLSLAWLVVVDHTAAEHRPWVMNSDHNRILDLTLHHNGIARLAAKEGFDPGLNITPTKSDPIPIGILYGGARGALRILGAFPGGLLAMTFPLFALGLARWLMDLRRASQRPAALVWMLWLLLGWTAFSFSRLGSPHYLELFAVPWAVTTAYGGCAALQASPRLRIAGLLAVGLTALHALATYGKVIGVGPIILTAAFGALLLTALCLRRPNTRTARAALGCLAVIPIALSVAAIRYHPTEGSIPGASFLAVTRAGGLPNDLPGGDIVNGRIDFLEPGLAYIKQRVGPHATYLAAVHNFTVGSAVIARHQRSVLAVRNEFRQRPELSGQTARLLVAEGKLRYFLIPPDGLAKADPTLQALLERGRNVASEAGYAPDANILLIDVAPADD